MFTYRVVSRKSFDDDDKRERYDRFIQRYKNQHARYLDIVDGTVGRTNE